MPSLRLGLPSTAVPRLGLLSRSPKRRNRAFEGEANATAAASPAELGISRTGPLAEHLVRVAIVPREFEGLPFLGCSIDPDDIALDQDHRALARFARCCNGAPTRATREW